MSEDDETWEITPRVDNNNVKEKKRSSLSKKKRYGSFSNVDDEHNGYQSREAAQNSDVQQLLKSIKFRVEYLEKEIEDHKSRNSCCCTQNCVIM